MSLIFVVFVLIGIIMSYRYFIWKTSRYHLLPGTKPNFFNFLGDIGFMAVYYSFIKEASNKYTPHLKIMELLQGRVERFRNYPLYCDWISFLPGVLLVKAEAVEQFLKSSKANDKSNFYKFLEPVLGSSVFTSSGEKWKSRRRLTNPCFHADILRDSVPIFNKRSQELVNRFQDETTKEFTDICTPIVLCTLDIICETVLGVWPRALENNSSEIVDATKRTLEVILTRIGAFWQWPDAFFYLAKDGREFRRHKKFLNDFSRMIIQERKRSYLSCGKGDITKKRKALIDVLLEKHLETKELSEEDIRQEVDTFAFAGHETVALTIMWTLYLIGLHADVQAKLHQELDDIFGEDENRPISEKDLNELSYLDCVLKEAQRLYPAAPFIARQNQEDIEICGYEIPKGTHIIILIYYLHRDEKVFPDPEKFDPERFFPENCANRSLYAYIPFSAGPRNCLGQRFAVMEMKTVIASLLRNYTIESLDERETVMPVIHITLVPSNPLRLRFRCRRNKNSQRNENLE